MHKSYTFLSLRYCPKKQVLNIGTSLTIKEDINFDILKESIYEAYSRCESMSLGLLLIQKDKLPVHRIYPQSACGKRVPDTVQEVLRR